MKSRELTADEIRIHISTDEISKIKFAPEPQLPVNQEAVEALSTGLALRGREMNIFLCGASPADREKLLEKHLNKLSAANNCSIVARKDDSSPYTANIIRCGKNEIKENDNILVQQKEDAPIIFEHNPIPQNLFGIATDNVENLLPGSILKSDGGLIVLNAEDLMEEEESWKLLKRTIRKGKTSIGTAVSGTESLIKNGNILKTNEINIDLKVVILGTEDHYDNFYNSDEDFRELFQIFSEIDSVIDLNEKNLSDTVNCLRSFSIKKLKRNLADDAALELVKYSISAAENKTKLSTALSDLELIILEADLLNENKELPITGEVIKTVLSRQAARFSLLEQRIIEEMKSGEIVIHLDGSEIGKVNSLAVIDKGPWAFGSPGLISARVAPGENGLVNIEHEAGLSGEIHDKWVLILEAFLRSKFAQSFPISLFASLCFEQSYSEVDGDSASSSELYALLSAISSVPLRQDIAVTGSLSQTGEIQAVGGLREKIEGFYKVCKAIKYTGTQGVIVPERNINSIILPDEILDEIEKGNFHIYTVTTVDDSMELLTGKEPGKCNLKGQFPPGTLNNLIEKKLKKLASQVKNFGN
ncbi:MAG: AAA family ATPase [Spirochaetales bacterium]|nr:AAA family ATPase [Spirochaetales bacterium]